MVIVAEQRLCVGFAFQWDDHLVGGDDESDLEAEKEEYPRLYGRGRREATRAALHKLAEIIPVIKKYEHNEEFIRGAAEAYIRERLAEKDELKEQAMRKGMSEVDFEQLYRDIGHLHPPKLQPEHDSAVATPWQASEAMDTESDREDEETSEEDVESKETSEFGVESQETSDEDVESHENGRANIDAAMH
jgi:hypothetical protein